jgi:hypothetical protein
MLEEVLPQVPYVQLVFTIPKLLRKAFLFDRSLYGELCRAAYASIRMFFEAQFPGLQGAVPAVVAAPQSFGSLLNHHPHIHAVASLGVFDRRGVFHPVPDDIDFGPLVEIFREHTFKALLKKEAVTQERVDMLRTWRNSGFNVDASRRVAAEDREGLQRLLEYMERAPVALERLQYLDDGRVLYRGRYHPGLGRDHQLVSGLEFLALALPHVALRFEVRIRTYGAISTTRRKRLGWIKEPEGEAGVPAAVVAEGGESEFVRLRRRSWARLIAKVWKDDPSLCSSCGSVMEIIAAITSPGQDDVIEKILKARGEWEPPWLRQPRTRGPPALAPSPSTVTTQEAWIDPPAVRRGGLRGHDAGGLDRSSPARRAGVRGLKNSSATRTANQAPSHERGGNGGVYARSLPRST